MVALGLVALLATGCANSHTPKKAKRLEIYVKGTKHQMIGVRIPKYGQFGSEFRVAVLTHGEADDEYLMVGISFPDDVLYPNTPSSVDIFDFKYNGYGMPDSVYVLTPKGKEKVNLANQKNLSNSFELYRIIVDELYKEKIDRNQGKSIDKSDVDSYIKMLHKDYDKLEPIPRR